MQWSDSDESDKAGLLRKGMEASPKALVWEP
jgi:hypothetical protein